MNRLARYQPPRIPPQALVAVVVIFAVLSFGRGLDYAVSGEAGQSLVVLEGLGDIRAWGAVIMFGSCSIFTAYALQRHFLIWFSHVLVAAIHVCIAVTIFQAISELGVGGWSQFAPPAGTVVWHTLIALLTGPFPRTGAGHGT